MVEYKLYIFVDGKVRWINENGDYIIGQVIDINGGLYIWAHSIIFWDIDKMDKKNAELKANDLDNIMLNNNIPYRFEVRSYYEEMERLVIMNI